MRKILLGLTILSLYSSYFLITKASDLWTDGGYTWKEYKDDVEWAQTTEEPTELESISLESRVDTSTVNCPGGGLYRIPEHPEVYLEQDEIGTAHTEEYLGEFELTAYTWTGNPCADGDYPRASHTVACNDSRLWHKWVTIEGYGTYYCHDTGGMSSNVIDIYMDSYDACIQFGRRSAKVYIVEEK